ncbi:MAG TPA: histidine phosphatase family protein [Gemmataceae bacterium]|jgi:phosphohistidine phosphatase|nr:histidine phosphatase family protein [Gemmataceae bacterium]
MDVYLIRHAEAIEREQFAEHPDEERPLTDVGHAQAQSLALALPARGAKILRLFVSPLVRTRQTAEPLVAAWGLTGDQVVETAVLAPEGKCRKVAKAINKQPAEAIGLVGHRPDLNELAAWLIGDKKAQIALDKGGVALVRVDGDKLAKGAGELIWLLPQAFVEVSQAAPKAPATTARRTRKRRLKKATAKTRNA